MTELPRNDVGLRESAQTLLNACHADFGKPEPETDEYRDDGPVGGGATPADDMAITFAMLRDLENALTKQPAAQEPSAAGVVEQPKENEDDHAYIARVLAMSSDEIRAEAEAVGIEIPPPRSLPASLRNLRFRLESALANRLQECDREAIGWLNEGIIAIGAALATITPAAPKTPDAATAGSVGDVGLREALAWYGEQARLARLIHSEGDSGRHALSDDGGKRAAAALAPQPPKAETPAGVGQAMAPLKAYEAHLAEKGDKFLESGFRAFRAGMRFAALSTAPAARPGDEVERDERLTAHIVALCNSVIGDAYLGKDREHEIVAAIKAELAAAPAANGGRA